MMEIKFEDKTLIVEQTLTEDDIDRMIKRLEEFNEKTRPKPLDLDLIYKMD